MADLYGVLPAEVAAELPALFPQGFGASTTPTLAMVTSWIATADIVVRLHARKAALVGTVSPAAPLVTDDAAAIAREYIKNWVKAQVIRVVYVGNDSERVENTARPYDEIAKMALQQLTLMGEDAVGDADASVPVSRTYPPSSSSGATTYTW